MTTARRAGAASAAALSGIALTLLLAHAAPSWVRWAGLDVWNLPSVRRDLRHNAEEDAALDREKDQLDRQIEAADHVAARLIAGGLTLAGAVDELLPLMEARPGFEHSMRMRFGAESFRQLVALYAIDKAGRLLAGDPAGWADVSARLRAEFAALE